MYLHARSVQVEFHALHAEAQEVESYCHYQRQNQHAQQPALHKTEHRQRKDIKADFAPEHRLDLSKRRGVREAQENLPARRHQRAEDHGEYKHHAPTYAQ